MKYFICICFSLISLTLTSQSEEKDTPSKHEIGLDFQTYGHGFFPKVGYHYYLNEKHILHFNGRFALGGSGDFQTFNYGVGLEFWNEYRSYMKRNNKWFLSHGFTLNTGISNFQYNSFKSHNVISGIGIGAGYKFGLGYKINDHFNITGAINPSVNYQIIDHNGSISNQIKLNAPISLGINYRF